MHDSASYSLEIERKFLLERPDFSLTAFPHTRIAQGYISVDPVIRLRSTVTYEQGQNAEEYFLTIKSGGGMERGEFESRLTAAQFASLWKKVETGVIEKTRYFIPLDGGLTAELDAYHGALEGFYTVEVEFSETQAAHEFIPPVWFGADVTHDCRYSNASLAAHGLPDPM